MLSNAARQTIEDFYRAPIQLAEGDDASKPVQILIAAKFRLNKNQVVDITPKMLSDMVTNFDNDAVGIELAFNYEHRRSPAHGTAAAGWIEGLELRNQGRELWAVPRWTPKAMQLIKDEEFRYLSAEITEDFVNNMTGKKFRNVLAGVALTNTPIVKGMDVIAASEFETEPQGEQPMNLSEIRSELLGEHRIDLARLESTAGKYTELSEKFEAQTTELSEAKASLTKSEKSNETLKATVKLSEKAKTDVEFSALVKKGMDEGKLTKAFAEGSFKVLYETSGVKVCETMLSEMAPTVDTGDDKGTAGGDPNAKTPKDPALALSEMANKRASEKDISYDDALDQVMAENTELSEKYNSQYEL